MVGVGVRIGLDGLPMLAVVLDSIKLHLLDLRDGRRGRSDVHDALGGVVGVRGDNAPWQSLVALSVGFGRVGCGGIGLVGFDGSGELGGRTVFTACPVDKLSLVPIRCK